MMTYADFRKQHKATRHFMTYTFEERANHAASRRLGHRQREATGEFFYTHPLCGDAAFRTAKAATNRAYSAYVLALGSVRHGEWHHASCWAAPFQSCPPECRAAQDALADLGMLPEANRAGAAESPRAYGSV